LTVVAVGDEENTTDGAHHATSDHAACWPTGFHLSPWPVWVAGREAGELVPERFAEEGFVHLTLGLDRLLVPANAYYRDDRRRYVALAVDMAVIEAEVRFDSEPFIYPHLYGALPTRAVTGVRDAIRASDGSFVGWGPAEPP